MKRKPKRTPTPKPKLLPCPCCGGQPTYMEEYGSKSVSCTACGLHTASMAYGISIQRAEEAEIAVAELWNRRTHE